jgi:hypothetical protein
MKNNAIQFYADTVWVQDFLSDGFAKQAQSGLVMSLVSKVKDYISGKIDPNNKVDSVVNLLTPGILWSLGFPVLGFIVKLAQIFFGLDVGKVFSDVAQEVKSLLTSGTQISPSQVDQITDAAVQANYGTEPTENDLKKFQSLTTREARLFKISILNAMQEISIRDLEQWQSNTIPFNKRAQVMSSLLKLIGLKHKTASILGKIIGWVVKTILASAGFMVGSDIIEGLWHKVSPSSSETPETPSSSPTTISIPEPTQTLFPVNPNYSEESLNIDRWWIEPVPSHQIGNQIVDWTEEIYPKLKGMDSFIRSSPAFQKVVQVIQNYNSTNASNITFMPKMFSSRKKVVDLFIDDLANKAQLLPTVPPNKPKAAPA